jgi:hypothetical protein
MGGSNGRPRSAPEVVQASGNAFNDPRNFYDLSIIPTKPVFSPGIEDISGQVVLDLKRPFAKPGIIVISLDGKESFEFAPISSSSQQTPHI